VANRNDFTNIVAYMKLCFSNYYPIIEGGLTTIDVMEDLLSDVPSDELQVAVKACCLEENRAFAPSPGELRGMVSALRMKKAGVPSVGEAWQEVYRSFERMPSGTLSGGGHSPILDHPSVVETVRQMGGFDAIALEVDNGQASFARSRFTKLYDEIVDRRRSEIAEHPQIAAHTKRLDLIDRGLDDLTLKLGGRK